jgi:ubiquinone/menaquinone biosynthesis C-methylase UbiE
VIEDAMERTGPTGAARQPGHPEAVASTDVYTHGHHDAVLRSHRWRTAANSAAYLTPHLRPGMSLLDVGCGPGTLTAELAALVAPGAVVGVDTSAEVVEEARRHADATGVRSISWVVGDFREADLGGGGFDVVHAHQVLQHLRDPVGALRAMRRLLRPGGVVAARDADYPAFVWTHPAAATTFPALDRWREIYLSVTRHNGAEAAAGRHLLGWAHRAGFARVSYSTSTWTFATAEERRWWADLWAERSIASSFAEQAVAYGVSSAAELRAVAAGWRAWAADPDAVFIVVNGEILAWEEPAG